MEEYQTHLNIYEKLAGIICVALAIFGVCMTIITKVPSRDRPPISESGIYTKEEPVDYNKFENDFKKRLRETIKKREARTDAKRQEVLRKYLSQKPALNLNTTPPSGSSSTPDDMWDYP